MAGPAGLEHGMPKYGYVESSGRVTSCPPGLGPHGLLPAAGERGVQQRFAQTHVPFRKHSPHAESGLVPKTGLD